MTGQAANAVGPPDSNGAPVAGPDGEPVERRQLRELTRRFVRRDVLPHLDRWERAGSVPRELHRTAADLGLLGVGFPEAVGGSGGDLLDSLAVTEELILAGGSSGLVAALFTHGIALPHLVAAGDPTQIDRYVRPTMAGLSIGALAVTEPDGGSDVAGLRTTARRDGQGNRDGGGHHDGGEYVVDGAKTYVTSGSRADFVTTAVRTGRPGARGVSLLVIDTASPGVTVGRPVEKLGWHCSDTVELSFTGVRVPAANLVGAESTGFTAIMRHFAAERLSLATQAYATARRCLDLTLAWCRQRHTFGRALADRQLIRHRLAEMATRTAAAQTFVGHVAAKVAAAQATAQDASVQDAAQATTALAAEVAMAKNIAVAACDRVVDQAVQLHGGYGYVRGSEVERHYRDARILGIGGGTTEIMNEIIAKGMGV